MSQLIYRYEAIKRAAELSSQQMQSLEPLVQDILTKVVIETLRQYQKKLNVGIQDSVNDLLDNFKQKITQEILSASEVWKVANKREDKEPVLFPKGCRFCWTKGDNTIFIVEQDPQVRNLSFMKNILGRSLSHHVGKEYISLALPYVVFVVHFRKDKYYGLYCGWNKRPLASIDDMLYRPLLPNIHPNLNVCMAGWKKLGTITEQSMDAIASFWNSTFNDDLSSMWWEKSKFDLKTAKDWQDKSTEDSNFILNIDLYASRSIRDILNLLVKYEQEPDENGFRHKLHESIDACVESMSVGIMRYFKKTKFDRYYPTDITEAVKRIFEDSFKELADIVFVLEAELQKITDELAPETKITQGVGEYWHG